MRRQGASRTTRTAAAGISVAVCAFLLVPLRISAQARGDFDRVLQDLESYAIESWDPAKVPGFAYAVVKGSEMVYVRGFGQRSQEPSSGPVDEHTLFEIGSTTKAFNAAVLGTVVDEGKAAWSDRVRDHLRDFKMYDPWVTKEFRVEDLMAQRSGMPPYALDLMSLLGFGRADIRRATRFVEPVTSFRSAFGYQNCLHLWASELIEEKTGLTWEEAVRRRILEPLGMAESTFDPAAYDANPNHCLGHLVLEDGSLWTIPPDWPYRGWLTTYAPAGGLCSNAADMAKWVALQLGNGAYGGQVILRPETLQAIRAPRIYQATGPTGVSSYAMGWSFQSSPQTPWYVHDGETEGMHSIVAVYPEWDLGLVVLTNTPGNKIPECMAFGLLAICTGAEPHACPSQAEDGLLPDRRAARAAAPLPESVAAIPPGKLSGTYKNPAYGKAIVRKNGAALTLTLGPARRVGPLTLLAKNRYRFDWPDWPGMVSTLTFKADATGEVTKLTIEEFSDVDGGAFQRTGD